MVIAAAFHAGLGSALFYGSPAKSHHMHPAPTSILVEFETTLQDHLGRHESESSSALDEHRGHGDAISYESAHGHRHFASSHQKKKPEPPLYQSSAPQQTPIIVSGVYGNRPPASVESGSAQAGAAPRATPSPEGGSALLCDERRIQSFFPNEAKAAGLTEATVTLRVTVTPLGRISAQALNDPGHGLKKAAENAVRHACRPRFDQGQIIEQNEPEAREEHQVMARLEKLWRAQHGTQRGPSRRPAWRNPAFDRQHEQDIAVRRFV